MSLSLQIALLDGVEIGPVVVVVIDLDGEVDALVVHAAAQADGGGLGLGGIELVAVVDVEDGAAVGDDVALEVPPAAELVLKQELVGAGGLAVDGVVGTHDGAGLGPQ